MIRSAVHPFKPRGRTGTLDGTCLFTQLVDALEDNQVGRLAVHLLELVCDLILRG